MVANQDPYMIDRRTDYVPSTRFLWNSHTIPAEQYHSPIHRRRKRLREVY